MKAYVLWGQPVAETCLEETLCDGKSYSHHVALSERTGGVLYTGCRDVVRGGPESDCPTGGSLELFTVYLPVRYFRYINMGRYVSWVEEEAVAGNPGGIIEIGNKEAE